MVRNSDVNLGPKYALSTQKRFSDFGKDKSKVLAEYSPDNYNKGSYIFGADR